MKGWRRTETTFVSGRVSPESGHAGMFQYVIVLLLPHQMCLSITLFEFECMQSGLGDTSTRGSPNPCLENLPSQNAYVLPSWKWGGTENWSLLSLYYEDGVEDLMFRGQFDLKALSGHLL